MYLTGIAKFLGRFRDVDPRFVSSADTHLAPVIAKVLAEQKRWESVPNRREPFTLPMLYTFLVDTAHSSADPHGLHAAMANWAFCNLYAGCRGIEWAQQPSATCSPLSSYYRNQYDHAYAFTLADVRCSTDVGSSLTTDHAASDPASVGKIHLRFEEQKNGDNGYFYSFGTLPTQPYALSLPLSKSFPATMPSSVPRAPSSL